MARIAVVTSSPPASEGGHLVIGRALTRALNDGGHEASLLVTPDHGFGRNLSTYWSNRRTQVGDVDQVISLRYPSYAIKHRPHVCWLNHTMREYYDLWPRFSATLSALNYAKESVRRQVIRTTDAWLLSHNIDRLVAQSQTIARRLRQDFDLVSDVVLPPAPQRPYRCDRYGDYILALSRLVPLKRVDLLIRALAEPPAQEVRIVVAGEGESRSSLEQLAASLGVRDRISFVGHAEETALVDHLAGCRAVCFIPYDEDYGFVTIEAFSASKAVITCSDSGGPTELVSDEQTGFVVAPTASAIASALGALWHDEALAARLGAAAKRRADEASWESAIKYLVIV